MQSEHADGGKASFPLATGTYFGEMALISGAPRSATARAAVATEAILLGAAQVKQVLSGNESLRAEMDALTLRRMRQNEDMGQQGESGNLISF